MKKNKPSISDVAESAGVSIATVSHVINKTRFVSPEVTDRVHRAITNLGYMPSSLARGLAGKETRIIGIIFSDISNPFFTAIYKGLESVLSPLGYEMILANTGEIDKNQDQALRTMLSRQIDGLIMAPTGRETQMLSQLDNSGIPVVLIDREVNLRNSCLVDLDNHRSAYDATVHLINDGYRRIGLILGLPDVTTTITRKNGYVDALKNHSIPIEEAYIVNGQSSIEGGYNAIRQLMGCANPPEAVLCTNNLMTTGALQALRQLDLNCPSEIGLIGFDDHDWSELISPPLTVIKQPTFQIGVKAAEILISNKQSVQICETQFQGELIVRGSCSESCRQKFLDAKKTHSKVPQLVRKVN